MITIFGATLFCGDFNSSNFSYSNAIVFLINSLQVFSTFLLLVFTVIKLGHRITQGNCAAVNTTRQYFRTTWPYYHIEFIEFFNLDLVSSHITYHKYNICIHSFLLSHFWCLTLSWRRPLSYRTQSIDLLRKSMDWFLCDNGLRHERVKSNSYLHCMWGKWWKKLL